MRCAPLAAALLVFGVAASARADGVMVYREQALFREGPAERGYCDPSGNGSPAECDRVLTKVLSGYSYGRGHVTGGLASDPLHGSTVMSGVGVLGLSIASAELPGGDIKVGSVDAAFGGRDIRRVRATLMDVNGLFVCRDTQSGALVAPMIGMLTRACAPEAWLGLDLGLLAMQWDWSGEGQHVLGEWLRIGPALELLGNGLSYSHVLRSVELALPFDLRSANDGERLADTETSLGVGLRISAFFRTPHWETRLSARHRASLAGGAGVLRDNSAEGELLVLHDFFLSDAIVMQAGVSLRASWSQEPRRSFSIWASTEQHLSAFAGLHLGWVHEAPGI